MPEHSTIIACPNCGKRNRVRPTASGVPRRSVCQTLLPWIVEAGPRPSTRSSTPRSRPGRLLGAVVRTMPHGLAARRARGREHAGRLKVVKLNVDEAPAISDRYGVQGIPLLVLCATAPNSTAWWAPCPTRAAQWLEPHLAPASQRTSGSHWPRRRQTPGERLEHGILVIAVSGRDRAIMSILDATFSTSPSRRLAVTCTRRCRRSSGSQAATWSRWQW